MARKPKKSEAIKAEAEALEASKINTNGDVGGTSTNPPAADDQLSQCGGVLSAARVKHGFSTKEVAKQLRLSNTQIEALEQDDFVNLPEATIVKGFIRNYAKLLKIPTEPLLNAYAQMAPAKEDYSFTLNPSINMRITENRKSHKLRYFLIVLGILLGAGVWFFYQNYVQKPNPINPMPEIAEALPELDLPMTERIESAAATQLAMPLQIEVPVVADKGEQVVVSTDEMITERSGEAESAELNEIDNSVAADINEEVVETEGTANDVAPALGKTRLAFTATQETWLSIINTTGKEVYNKTLYAGDHDVVDIRQPSEVVVGNAHGAALAVDGKSVDLAPYTRVNVARVRMNRLP